jgi:outer membrane protein assembly factor BamB
MGAISAVDLATGKLRWSYPGNLVGPPAATPDGIAVVSRDGVVRLIDRAAASLGAWPLSSARGPVDGPPDMALGPLAADGALWLVDQSSVIWRVGPPATGVAAPQLAVRWAVERPNFSGTAGRIFTTPAGYGERLAVVDDLRQVQLMEPDSGSLRQVGRLPGADLASTVDPIVARDRIVAVVGETLVSAGLAPGVSGWTAGERGITNRPAAADHERVYWLSASQEENVARISALRLEDGATVWAQPLRPAPRAGGVIVADGTLYVSSPPAAFDAQTGQELWRVDVSQVGVGGPTLSADGRTLYVALYDAASQRGLTAAIDAQSGQLLRRTELPRGVLDPFERLWLSGDTLVLHSITGEIVGLEAATGEPRWYYRSPGTGLGNISVSDGRVWLIQENGQVYVVDALSGRVVARMTGIDRNLGAPSYHQRPYVGEHGAIIPLGLIHMRLDAPQ